MTKDFHAATGVMTAFSCVGNTWSGGNNGLLYIVSCFTFGVVSRGFGIVIVHTFVIHP